MSLKDVYSEYFISKLILEIENSRRLIDHAKMKGDKMESIVASILKKLLPQKYKIESRQKMMYDHGEGLSTEQDLLIFNPHEVAPIFDEFPIMPIGNVIACIEVKTTLNATELESIFENVKKIREEFLGGMINIDEKINQDPPIYAIFAFDIDWKTINAPIKIIEKWNENHYFSENIDLLYIMKNSIVGNWILEKESEDIPIFPFQHSIDSRTDQFLNKSIKFIMDQIVGIDDSSYLTEDPSNIKELPTKLQIYGLIHFVATLLSAMEKKESNSSIQSIFDLTSSSEWIGNPKKSKNINQ